MEEKMQKRIKLLEDLKTDLANQRWQLRECGQAFTDGQIAMITQEIKWLMEFLSNIKQDTK